MPGKSVALSVRLSQEEASFLATWNPSGVTSLSEKVRMIIKEAAQRQSGTAGYSELLSFWENTLAGPMHQLREAEAENDLHSELMDPVRSLAAGRGRPLDGADPPSRTATGRQKS